MVAATRCGLGEAHALEGGQGLGVVLDAGEHQAAEPRRQRLLAGEQHAVVAFDGDQQPADRGVEAFQGCRSRPGRRWRCGRREFSGRRWVCSSAIIWARCSQARRLA
jgi:hypothetical protein